MLDPHLIAKTSPLADRENTVLYGDYRISILTDRLFRVERDNKRKFCNEATQSVWFRNMPRVDFKIKTEKNNIKIATDSVELIVDKDFQKSYVILDRKKIALSNDGNLLGTYRTLDGCDGNEKINFDGTREPIKLEYGVVSRNGVAIYDDTAALILKQDGSLAVRNDDELDIYVFAYGNNYREAIKALYLICGKVPMIPKYALGNWWSRYYAYTEHEYLNVMDRFSRKDIPLTVATVDVDWHWFIDLDKAKQISSQGKNDEHHGFSNGKVWGYTGYSWNTDLFPDYRAFLKKLHERGLHITLNLHPADGVRYYEDSYVQMAERMGVDPSTEAVIPFDFTNKRFINAYFDILHKPYERDGVDFWWIDWQQGTKTSMPGLDPLWALNHYHTLDSSTDHTPLILSRYCGIGSHRYPLGFSGDTHVTWKSLAYLPYFTSTATNAGYTWWSHDIGGHKAGIKDDELYVRYVQFGVFSPINRLHCTKMECATKEPSVYMGGTGMIAENFLKLRHKMIPFLYSAAYETAEYGQPLIEPMYYEYPNEKNAYSCPNQYMFGRQLIVAPVITPSDGHGLSKTRVWVPEGHWTDIFTGDEYDGGRFIDMIRWLDSIPVLARQGGFFVLDGRRHTNSLSNPDILDVMVFNGDGKYVLHEEDDEGILNTEFVSVSEQGCQRLTVTVKGTVSDFKRNIRLEFRNIHNGTVTAYENGESVEFAVEDDGYVSVILTSVSVGHSYDIELSYENDVSEYRKNRLLYALQRIEGSYEDKRKVWERGCLLDEEFLFYVDSNFNFTKRQKQRLVEAFPLTAKQ